MTVMEMVMRRSQGVIVRVLAMAGSMDFGHGQGDELSRAGTLYQLLEGARLGARVCHGWYLYLHHLPLLPTLATSMQ